MSKATTFSVGIPTFNQGDFLEETILSLLNQKRPPDEIVISDQYSTDATPDIIARYAKHVRGVRPPPDCGISGQWNFTFSSLSGDWVTLLSSDDLARPNFCETLLRGAARRDDAVLVRAAWENIDREGKVLSPEYMRTVKPITLPPDTLIEQKLGPKASFAAFAVRRETLVASGGYPAGMESFGDWPLFAQLSPFGSFIYENEIISGYRVGHDGNKFRNRLGMWLRDEQRMFYDIMPLAAERLGLTDLTWLEAASHTNFRRYLAAASKEFPPAERSEIAPLFQSWAARLGVEPLVTAFARGENVRSPFDPVKMAKSLLRPLAQKVYAGMRPRTRCL